MDIETSTPPLTPTPISSKEPGKIHYKELILVVVALFIFSQLPSDFTKNLNASPAWEPEISLSSSSVGFYNALAANGNTVHVVRGEGTIFYRRSIDEGTTWSSEINLGSGWLYLEDPLVADGSNVYIAYFKNIRTVTDFVGPRPVGDIFIRVSRDNGVTWEPEIQLTTAQSGLRLSLVVSASRVHLTWMDYRAGVWDLYYRRSLDDGASWEPEIKLVAGIGVVGAERPSIASIGDSVHLAWMDGRDSLSPCTFDGGKTIPECTEIYYKRSLDSGASWGLDTRLTSDEPYSGRPEIGVVNASTVIISYDQRYDDGLEIHTLRSTDNGTNWGLPQRMSFAADDGTHSKLEAGGSSVHLTWMDRRDSTYNIYYLMSEDDGAIWEPEEQISFDPNASTPFLGVTSNYIHVSWVGSKTGSKRIWYRRKSLTATPYATPYTYPTPTSTTTPIGPVGWWKFDETTGITTLDSSGSGWTGTLINGPLRVSGKSGNALSFDGANDYVLVSDIPRPTDLSLSAWIYPTATSNVNDFIILNKHNSEYDLRLLAGPVGSSRLLGLAGGVSILFDGFDFASPANRNQWYHVVYTFNDSANTHKLYINGVLVASGTNSNSIVNTSTPLRIGRHSQYNFGSFLGNIDDVRIYDLTLTDAEVEEIYSGI
jgi:hypothetical protein